MGKNKLLILGGLAVVAYWYWASQKKPVTPPSRDATGMGMMPVMQGGPK